MKIVITTIDTISRRKRKLENNIGKEGDKQIRECDEENRIKRKGKENFNKMFQY